MQYDQQTICNLLNALRRYDEVEQRGMDAGTRVEECHFGDYVKLEDVAALFNLISDTTGMNLSYVGNIIPPPIS